MRPMNLNQSDEPAKFVAEQTCKGGNASAALLAALDQGHAENVGGKTRPLTDELLRDIAHRGRASLQNIDSDGFKP
jgi:hypothetical protein